MQVIYMRTRDNDPVISLHLSESFLTLGDVNGELHRIEVLPKTMRIGV